jgi:NTP pyrophosphatase (non-canonical NTP hydrolase)
MDMNEYQEKAAKTDDTGKSTVALYGLAGEIGGLFSLFKKRIRDRQIPAQFKEDLREELGDILWYLSALASKYGISLSEIAISNLDKIEHLFGKIDAPFFDDDFKDEERLPTSGTFEFHIDGKSGKAVVLFDGQHIGDPLSDNTLNEDQYKFHDIFHVSLAAHLHWSPVLRRLLKRKRKSSPKVDESEDSARAVITEEAAVAVIFSFAEQNAFFEHRRSIPFSLIKMLQRLTSNYEVSACTAAQWREAIYSACEVFVDLKKNNGGKVLFDSLEGTLEFVTG